MKLDYRKVLHFVRSRKIKEAIENLMRRTAQGGSMDMAYLLKIFDVYLIEEKIKVGLQ